MNVFACYDELKAPNPRRIDKVLYRSVGLQLILYSVVAVFGFASFGVRTPDNILVAYDLESTFANVGRLCVSLQLLLAIPLTVHPGRTYLWPMIKPSEPRVLSRSLSDASDDGGGQPFMEGEIPTVQHVFISASFLVLSALTAWAVPSASNLMGIVGGFACVTYVFLLPAQIAVRLREIVAPGSTLLTESPAAFLATDKAVFVIWALRACGVFGYIAAAQSVVAVLRGEK
jgi:amino acid permease